MKYSMTLIVKLFDLRYNLIDSDIATLPIYYFIIEYLLLDVLVKSLIPIFFPYTVPQGGTGSGFSLRAQISAIYGRCNFRASPPRPAYNIEDCEYHIRNAFQVPAAKISIMASQLSQDELQDTLIIDLRESVNGMWLILCGALVLFMQAGFALVEVGSVSEQNTTRIMMKNVADALAGLTVFYLVGFGIAYGKSLNGFIGISYYCVSMADPKVLGNFFFQAAFCCTSATIVSGAVAERMKFKAYVLFSSFMSAWIYPVVVHWVWGGGFLSTQAPEPIFGVGVYDFAGSGVVHMCGGTSGPHWRHNGKLT
eukprot:g56482.t1